MIPPLRPGEFHPAGRHPIRQARKGDFTSVYTGRQFWPLDPRPEEVTLEDIAHALSLQCRWGGHINRFYSVAQHCISVSLQSPNYPREGLLHDAAEAYLVDVPTPIKKHLNGPEGGYNDIEEGLLRAIGKRFGVDLVPLPKEVHEADARALATEHRDLRPQYEFWSPPGRPWPDTLYPLPPDAAKQWFLARAESLGLR